MTTARTDNPIETAALDAVNPRTVYLVVSAFGSEGIYSTPERARNKVNLLVNHAAYRTAQAGLMVRPYILDSE